MGMFCNVNSNTIQTLFEWDFGGVEREIRKAGVKLQRRACRRYNYNIAMWRGAMAIVTA
jgi:hypothetical protein